MRLLYFLVTLVFVICLCRATPSTFIHSQSGALVSYNGYSTVNLLNFNVPQDTFLASLRLVPIYGDKSYCSREIVHVVIKPDSPPVINPDGAQFPDGFFNFNRPETYFTNISSETPIVNIKLANPRPGKYFISAFLPAVDLREESVATSEECNQFLDVSFYTNTKDNMKIIRNNEDVTSSYTSKPVTYKLFVPVNVDHLLLSITNETYCNGCNFLDVKMNRLSIGSSQRTVIPTDNFTINNANLNLWTIDNSWYYLQMNFINFNDDTGIEQVNGSVSFSVKFIKAIIINNTVEVNLNNTNDLYLNTTTRIYRNNGLQNWMVYDEYVTVLQRLNLPFTYFYHIGLTVTPVIIQLDSNNFVSVPFHIVDELDTGGTIKVSLRFVNQSFTTTNEQYKIVGCIRRDVREIPIWPFHCKDDENSFVAPILLNSSEPSSSVYLPFPEPGRWFLTFRLFCNVCDACNCSESCQSAYETCITTCEQDCESEYDCSHCTETCRFSILNTVDCKDCNCEGNCLKTNTSCSTSVRTQIVSSPCVDRSCGTQGSCSYILNQGYVLSTCRCQNNYRGWDCSDNTYANSFGMVLLEYLLLTLSNIAFVPSGIIAFKRKYYVPCIMYCCVFIASTIYHACDAGESIISYCLLPFGVLQYADFFCAMAALWTTIVSIGFNTTNFNSIFYVTGTVAIAIGVRADMMSVWFYVIFGVASIIIIFASWSFKFKVKRLYPKKRYLLLNLPLGLILLIVGLLFFGLSTRSTYKYFHSLWHILMAVAVFIVLPKRNIFLLPR